MDVYKAAKKRIVLGNISEITKPGFTWVNCSNPSEAEIEHLAKILKLRKKDIVDYINRNQRPKTVQFEKDSLLLVKTVNISKWSMYPLAIFISDRYVITISKDKLDAIEKVLAAPQDVLSTRFTTAKLTRVILEEVTDLYFVALDKFEDDLDRIERALLNEKEEASVKKIFNAKKGLTYVHKALTANREVLSSIEKAYIPQIPKKETYRFREVYHDITQLIDMDETYRDIITGMLDTHLSNASNRTNKVVKKLTAGGALILVPTFITGLYGMNFRFMPEIAWQHGYLFAWGLMGISVLLLYIYFKKNDYF